jgi:SPRY domain
MSCCDFLFSSSSESNDSNGDNTTRNVQHVKMDEKWKADGCVIESEGARLAGRGCCIANAPLVQGKSYFEVRVDELGTVHVGVASRKLDFSQPLGQDEHGWALVARDSCVSHRGRSEQLPDDYFLPELGAGDVVGVSYDHTSLVFYFNGRKLEPSLYTVRGRVYPAVYVDGGGAVTVNFSNFDYPLPSELGFSSIMFERGLL